MYFPLKKSCSWDSQTKWIDCTYYSNCIRNFSVWIAFPKCNRNFGSLQDLLSKILSRSWPEHKRFLKEKQLKEKHISEKNLQDLATFFSYLFFLHYRVILKFLCFHVFLHFNCHKKFGYQYNVAYILVEGLCHLRFWASILVAQSFNFQQVPFLVNQLRSSCQTMLFLWIYLKP